MEPPIMWHLYGIALLAGVANAVEPGQNATLAKTTGQPLVAGLVCFAVAILGLLAVMAVARRLDPVGRDARAAPPWWAWPGGVLGAAIVVAQLTMSERMGAAPFLGLVVTGGVIASLVLDHFGWAGFERHAANRWRLAGGGLMIVGVTLVALF